MIQAERERPTCVLFTLITIIDQSKVSHISLDKPKCSLKSFNTKIKRAKLLLSLSCGLLLLFWQLLPATFDVTTTTFLCQLAPPRHHNTSATTCRSPPDQGSWTCWLLLPCATATTMASSHWQCCQQPLAMQPAIYASPALSRRHHQPFPCFAYFGLLDQGRGVNSGRYAASHPSIKPRPQKTQPKKARYVGFSACSVG